MTRLDMLAYALIGVAHLQNYAKDDFVKNKNYKRDDEIKLLEAHKLEIIRKYKKESEKINKK